MTKAVFLDSSTVGDTSLEAIKKQVTLTQYSHSQYQEVAPRIKEAEIVITNKCVLDEANLKAAKNLKLICIAATGMNNVDLDYCKKNQIQVRNVTSYSTESVCQYTLNLLFHYIHHNPYYFSYTQEGEWSNSPIFTHLAKPFFELKGKVWTIIGLGEIGRRLAEMLEAFGVKIAYVSITGSNTSSHYQKWSLEEALEKSDILSIHCRYSEISHHLISEKLLSKTKKKPIFINMARGPIVDEQAVANAIDKEVITAYLTDVMTEEPPPRDHIFFQEKYKERIVMSPHIAWSSVEARKRLIEAIATNIKDYRCS